MKRKKFWIVFSIVFLSIAFVFAAIGVATRLKTVDVELRSRVTQSETMLEPGIIDKVKESGDFKIGKNILFMNFKENIAKIEKENPYVKVEQVIRSFPNIVRVYISERIPKYRLQDKDNTSKWYILDEDFKILDAVTGDLKNTTYGSSNYYDKTVEISPDSLTISSYIGEFVNDEVDRVNLNSIFTGIFARTTNYFMVKSVAIVKNNNDFSYKLIMKNTAAENDEGCLIILLGSSKLSEKARMGVAAYCEKIEENKDVDLTNKKIIVEEINGKITVTSSDIV